MSTRTAGTPLRSVSLDDRYTAESGPALLSGTQALVRMLVEQRRLDRGRGLNTGLYVTGYPGSPLGGLDREIMRSRAQLDPEGVVFEPAVNEELGATAVVGTQLVGELPGRRCDGVVGIWYGKGPGLDRAADAIRHGNVAGTAHLGGALALIGDDPMCKSSTLPSSSMPMCKSLNLPVFTPSRVQDIPRLGLHAIATSRHAGLWTAMQILADVADAAAAVELGSLATEVPHPPAESRGKPPVLLGASSVAAEHDLLTRRLGLARDYGREHRLNRITSEPSHARIALVAGGATYGALQRALRDLGLDDAGLDALGIRVVQLELVWPLHPQDILDFTAGVEEVLVFEDKTGFIESQLRDALYRRPDAPLILGKHDADGGPLVTMGGAVDADEITRVLGLQLGDEALAPHARERIERVEQGRRAPLTPLPVMRKPFFCSGCPHNLSTRALPGQLVGQGIGCHALIALDAAAARGSVLGAPQMGGEGAQWNGMAPFTDDKHYVQNLGDGTFHHSGSLAIRAAVAARVNITYKLLYNDAVAMTGGQQPAGRMDIVTLTHWLESEGVARIILTAEEPETFDGAKLAPIARVLPRERFTEAEAELAAIPGVTVLIHTDRCATEERRLRKRGKLPIPSRRAWINERVCEGCGDCGAKSSCLSVIPVLTPFGRKTQIHQSSCTQDMTCLEGDCPSFVLVKPGKQAASRPDAPQPPVALPEPASRLRSGDVLIRMPGVGGTGVVTVSQILQMAALLDGRWSAGLDQTGLAQKGGPVVSDVRIADSEPEGALRASTGTVDVLLGLDLLGAASPDTLRTLDPERTVAVVNSHETPPADMITNISIGFPGPEATFDAIAAATRPGEMGVIDAQLIAERLFADHMPTNVVMLGAAYQHGCLPVSGEALEEAIRANGAAVQSNLMAFRWGRAAIADPQAVRAALDALVPAAPGPDPAVGRHVAAAGAQGPLAELLTLRFADLIAYQDRAYAQRYLDAVMDVARRERAATGDARGTPVAEAFAAGLYKLMAYKDEYEVARLHLDGFERAKLHSTFGQDAEMEVLLHPPALRAMGMRRKIKLGKTAPPLFRALAAGRRLRGTPLDPFGRHPIRRLERELVGEYRALVDQALTHLRPETRDRVAAIAGLPDLVRGYETIKTANVERFRREAERKLSALRDQPAATEAEAAHALT